MKFGGASGKSVRDAEKKFAMVHCHLIHHCNIPNGCERPVLRSEKSRGWVGAVGSDAALSAQSKCVRGGEMARFRGVWGERGCTSGTGAIDSERGISVGVDSIVNDVARVWGTGSSETPRFWGFWGVLGV